MSEWDAHSALVTSITALNVVPQDHIAFELRAFTPPDDDSIWLQLTNLPAERVPETLGDEGFDRYAGVFQIDVNGPAGVGVRTLVEMAAAITQYYAAGKRFNKNGTSVYIQRAQMARVMKDGPAAKIPVSIFWRTELYRGPYLPNPDAPDGPQLPDAPDFIGSYEDGLQ